MNRKKVLIPSKRITIGQYAPQKLLAFMEEARSFRNFRQEVTAHNYARPMISRGFMISQPQKTIGLIFLEIGQGLGFKEIPCTTNFLTSEFCEKWSRDHLDGQNIILCQPEYGPCLRREYLDQPEQEILFMAMAGIVAFGEDLHIFYLANFPLPDVLNQQPEPSLLIDGTWAHPTRRWSLKTKMAYQLQNLD